MAFIIKTDDAYSWPVSVKLPADGGSYQTMDFVAKFKRLGKGKIDEIVSTEGVTENAIASQVLAGWDGIQHEDGSDVPFDSDGLALVLDIPNVAASIVAAYLESMTGAQRKN